MSISEHERQALESIESDLASTGTELTAMLAIFARLTAGEEMPARERVRRGFDADRAATGAPAGEAAGRPAGPRRIRPRLRKQSPWLVWLVWLVWPVLAIALLTVALAFGHGGGRGACSATRTAACRPVLAPAGAGSTVNGGG